MNHYCTTFVRRKRTGSCHWMWVACIKISTSRKSQCEPLRSGMCKYFSVSMYYPHYSNRMVDVFFSQCKNCPVGRTWAEKKRAWYTLFVHAMLSSSRISGNLEISIKFVVTLASARLLWCERCLPLTMLCVDDDAGAMKTLISLLAGIVHTFVHFS